MAKIRVQVGELTKPLRAFQVNPGTTLAEFLEAHEMKYGSSIRVNGVVVKKSAKLNAGDIITSTESVSGGK